MWEVLLVVAVLVEIGCVLGLFMLVMDDSDFVNYMVVIIIALLGFIFMLYAYQRNEEEKVDEFKSKCYLEIHNGDVIWDVSSNTVAFDVHGIPFTLQVSDFKGKETRDGKEVLYTPQTMGDCFKQNR